MAFPRSKPSELLLLFAAKIHNINQTAKYLYVKSLLGGRKLLGTVGESTYLDANTLPLNSIGNCSPLSSNATNFPPGVARGEIETISMGSDGNTIMQKFWERGGDSSRQYVALYVRCYTGGNWYAWRKTTFDTYTV